MRTQSDHPDGYRLGIDVGAGFLKAALLRDSCCITETYDVALDSRPLEKVRDLLRHVREFTNAITIRIGATGVGATALELVLNVPAKDEVTTLIAGLGELFPDARTVVEMGKQSQKFLLLSRDPATGKLVVDDLRIASRCAAGGGAFLDHMVKRLNFSSREEFEVAALATANPASLSGRCSVFTESDIVHLYQKGTSKERIAAGLHQALSRNYRVSVAGGRVLRPPVAFVGGVSKNHAVVKYLCDEFGTASHEFHVPQHSVTLSAIGAALRADTVVDLQQAERRLTDKISEPLVYPRAFPLQLRTSLQLPTDGRGGHINTVPLAGLGVDIGSVSTKAALITLEGNSVRLLASYYRRTDGDPLAAVRDTLGKIHQQMQQDGYNVERIVAATTGSGRYLTGDYIGADIIRNEITAQAMGTVCSVPDADTVFEIGGQDSKYIRLQHGVIVDFEMNKACAAGCGAFLEKQAQNLGISLEQLGFLALKGQHPPDLDWQCTVFSESAMIFYLQNNVPVEDLCAGVCLAATKNYLNKNVSNRHIGNKIVFQGAVALNEGMVAAFETLLGKPIVVPPYPSLTGAIGAAVIAYRSAPQITRFRGFEQITEGEYEVSCFSCTGCPNHCDVNIFQIGRDKPIRFYYNDRCERYSGVHKQKRGDHLPDLFAEREKMLVECGNSDVPDTAVTVGYPRGFLFNEYFPFFQALFSELGARLLPSPPTSKQIIQMGVKAVSSDPCLPAKVAHGHVAWLVEEGVDFLFLPSILETEQPNPRLPRSQSCPYVQSAPEVIASALQLRERGVGVFAPRLYFNRGKSHFLRAFAPLIRKLGRTREDLLRALDAADAALSRFRVKLQERGREVCASLTAEQRVFVVIGRPYTLHDAALNMHIGRKIQDMGILALPMDFLPLDREDISDVWENIYSHEVQRKLAAARLVQRDSRFRAVVLTYFGCGPDSFANQFFKDELGEPCFMIQIDEHTADAGVITRLEAFADTVTTNRKVRARLQPASRDIPFSELGDRTVWIPNVCGNSEVLARALRIHGVNAQVLPRSTDAGLNLARRAIPEDVCVPALFTTQDILQRVTAPDFDPDKEAFFQGKGEGPCRFGMYHILQRRILDKAGCEQVPMVTFGDRDLHGGLGLAFLLTVLAGSFAHDLLDRMRLHTRPYELNEGDTDRVFEEYFAYLLDHLQPLAQLLCKHGSLRCALLGAHLSGLRDIIFAARQAFERIPQSSMRRPLIGLLGEFYVRLHDGTNQNIIRRIEQLGGEVWLAPATEFLGYHYYVSFLLEREVWRETRSLDALKQAVARRVLSAMISRDEHRLFRATLPYLHGLDDICARELVDRGAKYVHPTFGGETICSMGKADDWAERGLQCIISVVPFHCMPGITVDALSHQLRRQWPHVPFLHLDYDGFVDSTRDAKLRAFMGQLTTAG